VLERGVPVGALSELARREALSPDDLDRLIIPRRTLAHRKAKDQPLNRAESERALRVASLTALAEETFVNREKAQAWLRRPTSALGGSRPIDLLDSEPGARLVEQLLYRIGHGIAA
jgi:putative toxin-antitoxin system antitoxin component (TIGR02293 family)